MNNCAASLLLCACLYCGNNPLARSIAESSLCLPNVLAQRVLSSQLPSGALRQVDEFRLNMSLAAASEALAARLHDVAAPGHLMRQRVGHWRTFSFWRQKRFCVVQIRSVSTRQTEGLLTLTDYTGLLAAGSQPTDTAAPAPAVTAPPWWPSWQAGKVERWLDEGRRVTTMTGFSRKTLMAVREQIKRAAARGGLLLSMQVQVPRTNSGKHAVNRSGLLLIFRGPDRELAVTLLTAAKITSVVAHLEEL